MNTPLSEVEIIGKTCECLDDGTFNMDCAIQFARMIERAHGIGVDKPQVIHAKDCWSWGPQHYECACAEIAKLRGWKK